MRVRLDDASDARFEPFRDLRRRVAREPIVVIEGRLAVERGLEGAPRPFRVVGTAPRLEALGPVLARVPEVDVVETSHEVLQRVAGFAFHRGVLAAATRALPSFEQTVETLGPSPTVLVLERLADPANVGAAIRCARAFGVDMVVADVRGADPWERRAIRACAGHVFGLPVVEVDDVPACLLQLRRARTMRVIAASVGADARALRQTTPRSPGEGLALVMGNEGDGISPTLLEVCDESVRIEMKADVDSLNVAAASGVLLWALTRNG